MILYLDTTALVKVVVAEAGSDIAQRAVDDAATTATSLIAYAEARSALARTYGERGLSRLGLSQARRQLERVWRELTQVEVTADLIRRAGDLAEERSLRGMDAIHLASALALREAAGLTEVASWDKRLRRAAELEGFTLRPSLLAAARQ